MIPDRGLLVVFGATGGAGRAVLAEALHAGFQVRAFARTPAALLDNGAYPTGLSVVSGDVLDAAAVRSAVAGAVAVVSTLGRGGDLTPTTVLSAGTANIVAGMLAEGVARLVVVTSMMVTPTGTEPPFFRMVATKMLAEVHADHLRLEAHVKASDLDWTIVRPPRLRDGPARRAWRTAKDAGVKSGEEISRADLAKFLVAEVTERKFVRAGVGIAW
jgi:uncharacterized protein YbjT (DUF2867 family)